LPVDPPILSVEVPLQRDNKIRFQVTGADGRCSDIWRMWTRGSDVYLAPRAKGGEFKISLHQSGKRRIAFTREYAERMEKLGTWGSNHRVDSLDRPAEHAPGFTRAVWIYFPDSELRKPANAVAETKTIIQIPEPPSGGLRNVNLILTNPSSRFTRIDPPLRGIHRAECLASWPLPKGKTLWLVHFELAGRGVDRETDWFRTNLASARKLDERAPMRLDQPGRIMITGSNDQGWFCVIDAATTK
jgi:hypothetical protein